MTSEEAELRARADEIRKYSEHMLEFKETVAYGDTGALLVETGRYFNERAKELIDDIGYYAKTTNTD